MNELYDSIKCLYESSQRLQILNVLDSAQLDLRSLMTELDSPRTTLQRNLSVLEDRGWIEATDAGYTATTTGTLVREEVVATDKTVETINTRLQPMIHVFVTFEHRRTRSKHLTTLFNRSGSKPANRAETTKDGAVSHPYRSLRSRLRKGA